PPEVVALGQHLRAHEEIDLPPMDGIEHRLGGAAATRDVAVEPRDARIREGLGERLLEALGASPERAQVRVAAARALPGHGLLPAAMVADQPKARRAGSTGAPSMQHAAGAAVLAARKPTALPAGQYRRVAAP